jgi:hypothetical protein
MTAMPLCTFNSQFIQRTRLCVVIYGALFGHRCAECATFIAQSLTYGRHRRRGDGRHRVNRSQLHPAHLRSGVRNGGGGNLSRNGRAGHRRQEVPSRRRPAVVQVRTTRARARELLGPNPSHAVRRSILLSDGVHTLATVSNATLGCKTFAELSDAMENLKPNTLVRLDEVVCRKTGCLGRLTKLSLGVNNQH